MSQLAAILNGSPAVSKTVLLNTMQVLQSRYRNEVDPRLQQQTIEAMQVGHHLLQMYVFLCWIMFSPGSAKYISQREKPKKIALFFKCLDVEMLAVTTGIRPDLSTFKAGKLMDVLRQPDIFVLKMMNLYAHL